MNVPPNKESEWTSDDAIALRTFLESVSGQRFLFHVAENCPELLGGGESNSVLIRSGEVKGYSSSLKNILSLTIEPPQTAIPVSSNYPDLDDDSKWIDLIN